MAVKRRGYKARPNQVGHLVPGLIAMGVGAFVSVFLSRKADPAETAGIHLFGAYFIMAGLLFFSSGLQALRVPPLVVQVFSTSALVALAYPFNTIWTSPLVAFQVGKWVLNGIVLLALISTVMMIRRGAPVAAPEEADDADEVPDAASPRTRLVGAAVFGGLGVLLLLMAWQLGSETYRLTRDTLQAEGVVVRQATSLSRDSETGRSTPMYSAVVRFEVDGRGYELTQGMSSGSPMYAEGARVPVRYRPDDPAQAFFDDPLDLYFLPGLLGAIALVLFLFAAIAGWPRRRRKPAGSAPDWTGGVERR